MSSKSKKRVIQVTNIAPQTTRDQMQTLFGYIGRIEEIRLYPSVRDVAIPVQSRICYIKYVDPSCVGVAQHLTNTVFIDRALIVTPVQDGEIPEEGKALRLQASGLSWLMPPTEQKLPPHVISQIHGIGSGRVIVTVDPHMESASIPPYPSLPAAIDAVRVEEIRRTVLVTNLNAETTAQKVLDHFSIAGEVKYVMMCTRNDVEEGRAALIEFTSQPSVISAFKLHGTQLDGNMIEIHHATEAIEKPHAKTNEAAQKEIDEAMKRVREAQNMISASIDPGEILLNLPKVLGLLDKKRSRSRSRSRRTRSKSRRRSHSRSRRRSRSKSRRRSHSESRSRSRRSRSRKRTHSRARSRKRSQSRSKTVKKRSYSRSRSKTHHSRSRDRKKSRSKSKSRLRYSRSKSKGKNSKEEEKKKNQKEVKSTKTKEPSKTEKEKSLLQQVTKTTNDFKELKNDKTDKTTNKSPKNSHISSRSLQKEDSQKRSHSSRRSRSRSRSFRSSRRKSPRELSNHSKSRKEKRKERGRSKEKDKKKAKKEKDRNRDRKDKIKEKSREKEKEQTKTHPKRESKIPSISEALRNCESGDDELAHSKKNSVIFGESDKEAENVQGSPNSVLKSHSPKSSLESAEEKEAEANKCTRYADESSENESNDNSEPGNDDMDISD